MVDKSKDYKNDFIHQGLNATDTDYHQRGYHLEVALDVNQVRKFAQTAYDLGFYIVFVAGLHVRSEEGNDQDNSGLEVVYQFARYDQLYRIKARVSVPKSLKVPSISDIFQGADWHERETRDLFGVVFDGHPNLKPLLLSEEDSNFHPLLKQEEKLKSLDEVSWKSGVPETTEKEANDETG
ncbi:MAG: NADH-quinone oxidoreductase subunit C [Deltaproteobacteria bacterium]|jgi:NADH-quinone oxidoreductase subunit C|nr:NADH-quinone oxidoreductase subunit C [Deltaproteobacteria bacterium]